MYASIFPSKEAGTRAFMIGSDGLGTTLERFLIRTLRPADTHARLLIGVHVWFRIDTETFATGGLLQPRLPGHDV